MNRKQDEHKSGILQKLNQDQVEPSHLKKAKAVEVKEKSKTFVQGPKFQPLKYKSETLDFERTDANRKKKAQNRD